MLAAVWRKMPLVTAPAELGGLRALADEALDRPRVDELVARLRGRGDLGVALGDMDDPHAEPVGELAPLAAAARGGGLQAGVGREVEQRLLDEMRHQTG